MWKLNLFLLIVAVGSIRAQNDDDDDAPVMPVTRPPVKDRECTTGCEDGANCWYEGDWFLKDGEEMECKDGAIVKKMDEAAGKCLAHTESGGDKWVKPDDEYVLRCNTWKCSGEFHVMMFVKAACRDDMDKCFEDGETMVKNGYEVICRIYGNGHAYEFLPPSEAPPTDKDDDDKDDSP